MTLAQRLGRIAAAALLVTAIMAGCGGATTPDPGSGVVRVVATTTVFADLVRQVGGSRVEVASLVPAGAEVHTFDPTPSDARRLAEAKLIVMNGLGLDDWAETVATGTDATAPIVHLAEDLEGVAYIESGEGHADESGEHGRIDPHLWLDASLAARYVDRIAEALAEVDPEGASAYVDGAGAYRERLEQLDAEVREQLAGIPEERRRVVSFHDAFAYYARAYGLEVVGTIVDAPGQDPSAGEIGDLVRAIREAGVAAILTEVQFSPDLAETVAAETGVAIVADLYTGSLGEPPVDTYEAMLRWDTERIAEAIE